MFSRRKLTGVFLTLLLLVMQAFWLAHHLEHDLLSDVQEEEACEFCLAMHGMGAAIPCQQPVAALIPSDEYRPGYAFITRVSAESIQPRQQGPPIFS